MGTNSCKCCTSNAPKPEQKEVPEVTACIDDVLAEGHSFQELAKESVKVQSSSLVDSESTPSVGHALEEALNQNGGFSECQTKKDTAEQEKGASSATRHGGKHRTRVSIKEGIVNPEFLATIPLFKRCLSDEEIKDMAAAMKSVCFTEGELFIKQGDKAFEFFVILSGMVAVLIANKDGSDDEQVALLKEGDIFGEAALVTGGFRNASLRAETDVMCFSISSHKIKELGLEKRLQFTRRAAVGRECILDKNLSSSSILSSESNGASRTSHDSEDEALVNKALQSNSNLKHLLPADDNVAKEAMQYCKRQLVEKGTDVIVQGDQNADSFYVIEHGSFSVTVAEKRSSIRKKFDKAMTRGLTSEFTNKVVATLRRGQSFGELALLYRAPRAATVSALEDSSVWVLDRNAFKDVLRKIALSKNKDYGRYLDGLDLLSSLSSAEKRMLTTAFESIHFIKGSLIFSPGDESVCLYILIDGEVEIVDVKGRKKIIRANFGKKTWKYIGQEALLSTRPRSNKVTVLSPTARALTLDRNAFSMLLRGEAPSSTRNSGTGRASAGAVSVGRVSTESTSTGQASVGLASTGLSSTGTLGGSSWFKYIGYVNQLRVTASMPDDIKESVARSLTQENYQQSDFIYSIGDSADKFYILVDGTLEQLDGKRCTLIEACPGAGVVCHFGDREIINGKMRTSGVKVVSNTAIVLAVGQDIFVKLLSPYKDIFTRFWVGAEQIAKRDLTMMGVVAHGTFGPIEVCRHNTTGQIYALKTMSKYLIVKKEAQRSVMRERAVWLQLKSPFVMQLFGLYNEAQSLHYLLEFVSSGSLGEVYHLQGFYGRVEHARFYIAAVVCALRHIQKRRLIHRDVKPENILLSRTGHPKLCDFALAKPLIGKTFTTCGTPQYMAPEVLIGTGHTKAVDWWSMGIMVFELLAGAPPFVSESDEVLQVYSQVMKGISKVTFPEACHGDAEDLVRKLCDQDPGTRLVGAPNVMAHPWYQDFDWRAMASQSLDPPWRPLDSGGSNAVRESVHNHDLPSGSEEYVDDGSGWDRGFASNLDRLGSGSGISWTKLPQGA